MPHREGECYISFPQACVLLSWEFNVNESTEYFKEGLFKQKHTKKMVNRLIGA